MSYSACNRIMSLAMALVLVGAVYWYKGPLNVYAFGASGILDGLEQEYGGVGSSDSLYEEEAPDIPVGFSLGESRMILAMAAPLSSAIQHHVSTAAELKDALRDDDPECTVYLDNDIDMTEIIYIKNSGKTVTIDGQGFTLNQKKSTNYIYCATNTNITFVDLTIVGYSYYGAALGSNAYRCTITYDKVMYEGPQLAYTPSGTVNIKDCDITIVDTTSSGGNKGQELAEASSVSFLAGDGTTMIRHLKGIPAGYDADSFIWLHGSSGGGDPGIFVEAGAHVVIDSDSYFTYIENSGVLDIGEGAVLELTTKNGGTFGSQAFPKVEIHEDAQFLYAQNNAMQKNAANRDLRISGSLILHPGSVLDYRSQDSNGALYMGNGSSVTLDSPKLFSVYHASQSPMQRPDSTTASNVVTWNINGVNTVNYWSSHPGITSENFESIENMPQYIWHYSEVTERGDWSVGEPFPVTVSPSNSTGARGKITWPGAPEVQDSGNPILSAANIGFFDAAARRIALGNIDLSMDRVLLSDGAVQGYLDEGELMISYEDSSGIPISRYASSGGYSVAFGENTPMGGTQIKALANYRGLKALLEQMADGELRLVSVSDLHYGVNTLPTGPTIYYRTGDDMTVIVEDTRADGSDPWTLTVKLDTPFTNELESHSVDHALIFRTGSVSREISPAGVEAFSSAGEAQRLLYEITWGPAEGILASFNPGEPLPGEYKAVLQWELTCAP